MKIKPFLLIICVIVFLILAIPLRHIWVVPNIPSAKIQGTSKKASNFIINQYARKIRDTVNCYHNFQSYLDSVWYIPGGKDSSWVDSSGHKWRAYNGHAVATLPRGFPFWVIWDKRAYALTHWGKKKR